MSEKRQHTAARTQELMMSRYGNEYHHKHDKRHNPYRLHSRSHLDRLTTDLLQHEKINSMHGGSSVTDLQEFRKQLSKRSIH